MFFQGIDTATALKLAALMLICLVLLYLIKVRRKKVEVPYIFLWQRVARKYKKNKITAIFRRLVGLLLWLAVSALLIFALMDLRPRDDRDDARHNVVLLDSGITMCAKYGDISRFDAAKQAFDDILDDAGYNEKFTLVDMSDRIEYIGEMWTGDKNSLKNAISKLTCKGSRSDWRSGLNYAKAILSPYKQGRLILLTDGSFRKDLGDEDTIPATIEFSPYIFGESVQNIAISAFSARRKISDRTAFEVFLSVRNDFDVERSVKINIYHVFDGKEKLAESRVAVIAPRGEMSEIFGNLPTHSALLKAEVVADDALAIDNVAYASIPNFARQKVAAVTDNNLFLEASLLLNKNIDVTILRSTDKKLLNAENKLDLEKLANFDVVILDDSSENLPEFQIERGKYILINIASASSPFKQRRVNTPLVESYDKKSAVMRFIRPEQLNILQSYVFSPERGDKTIIKAIDGAIAVSREREELKIFALGFGLLDSDLVFRVWLPLLFVNALDWLDDFDANPGMGEKAGTYAELSVDADKVDIVDPLGEKTSVSVDADKKVKFYAKNIGYYKIFDGATLMDAIAVNADGVGADLTIDTDGLSHLGGRKEAAAIRVAEYGALTSFFEKMPGPLKSPWIFALFAALLLMMTEWLTYHRGKTE